LTGTFALRRLTGSLFKQREREQRIDALEYDAPSAQEGILATPVRELVGRVQRQTLRPVDVLRAYGKAAIAAHRRTNCLTEIAMSSDEVAAVRAQKTLKWASCAATASSSPARRARAPWTWSSRRSWWRRSCSTPTAAARCGRACAATSPWTVRRRGDARPARRRPGRWAAARGGARPGLHGARRGSAAASCSSFDA
jgi:hypothetical protein